MQIRISMRMRTLFPDSSQSARASFFHPSPHVPRTAGDALFAKPLRTPVLARTRIMLVSLPTLMMQLVRRALAADAELEVIVGESIDPEASEQRDWRGVDVIIIGSPSTEAAPLSGTILGANPRARVLQITPSDGVAVIYSLLPTCQRLGAVSPAEILRSVRDYSTHERAWQLLSIAAPG